MKKREPKVIDTATIEWLRDRDALIELFGEQEVKDALAETGYSSSSHKISTTEWYEYEPQWYNPRERVNSIPRRETKKVTNPHTRKEEWREITKHEWRIPSNYQSDVVVEIIKKLLTRKIPWFNKFEWSIYGNSLNSSQEIYLKTGYDHELWEGQELSLYVPIKALLSMDWKAIENRNLEYWKDYCKPSDRKWNNQDSNPTCQAVYDGYIEVLSTPAAQKLKELINETT